MTTRTRNPFQTRIVLPRKGHVAVYESPVGETPKPLPGASRKRTMTMMSFELFTTAEDAVEWLYVQGWRQNDDGAWLKGEQRAMLQNSPAKDSVVSVTFVPRDPMKGCPAWL